MTHGGVPDKGVFQSEICPCYRAVSGTPVMPRWITTKESRRGGWTRAGEQRKVG